MKKTIGKIVAVITSALLLNGCANGFHPLAGLGLNLHTQGFWNAYNNAVSQYESQAEIGQITWTEAANKIRLTDLDLAQKAKNYDTTWKFDSNDEEFHQYSIYLAEKVDLKLISVAQYKAMKAQKFNEVQARQQTISNQYEQTKLLRQNQEIIKNNQNKTVNCTVYGINITCN